MDGITLTQAAIEKVDYFIKQKNKDGVFLRISVTPGGCSGLRYRLGFDIKNNDGDVVKEYGNVKVVTDKFSAPYLNGTTIDFADTIEKQGFTIDNPNASNGCACGDSFS